MTKNTSKTISKKIMMPRWVVIVFPVLVAIIGIYTIYNTFAFQKVTDNWSSITSDTTTSVAYVYCSSETECYDGQLLNTTQTEAFVRKSQDSACSSGYQYAKELNGVSTTWRCVLVAGD